MNDVEQREANTDKVLESLRKLVIFKLWIDVVILVLVLGLFILIEQQHRNINQNTTNVKDLTTTVHRVDKSVDVLTKAAQDLSTTTPEEAARNKAISDAVLKSIPQIREILCQVYPTQCQATGG